MLFIVMWIHICLCCQKKAQKKNTEIDLDLQIPIFCEWPAGKLQHCWCFDCEITQKKSWVQTSQCFLENSTSNLPAVMAIQAFNLKMFRKVAGLHRQEKKTNLPWHRSVSVGSLHSKWAEVRALWHLAAAELGRALMKIQTDLLAGGEQVAPGRGVNDAGPCDECPATYMRGWGRVLCRVENVDITPWPSEPINIHQAPASAEGVQLHLSDLVR